MTLIFISGPISGHSDLNKPAFMQADEDLQDQGYITFNIHTFPAPFPQGQANEKELWQYFMRVCVRELTKCDEIYMLAHWQNSDGAVWEHRIAKMLGMRILYQEVT